VDAKRTLGAVDGLLYLDDYDLNNPYKNAKAARNVQGFAALKLGRGKLQPGKEENFGDPVNELSVMLLRNANTLETGGRSCPRRFRRVCHPDGTPSIAGLDPKIEGVEECECKLYTIGTPITNLRKPITIMP